MNMKKITPLMLRVEFKSLMMEGLRPTSLTVGSLNDGGFASYPLKNSKSPFPVICLSKGEYVVFGGQFKGIDPSWTNY
jgi:hypothetical protein